MTDRDRHMTRIALGGALAVLLLGAGAPAAAPRHDRALATTLAAGVSAAPAAVAPTLARHSLRLLDGSSANLGRTAGEVVVVNFWATWCRPCLRELPALERLHAEIAPRGGRVLAVAIDTDRRNVERYIRANGLALPVAHDGPTGLARKLDLKAVPLTLVLDRSGEVAWASTLTDEAGLAETRAAVLRLLAAPVPTPALAGEDAEGTR